MPSDTSRVERELRTKSCSTVARTAQRRHTFETSKPATITAYRTPARHSLRHCHTTNLVTPLAARDSSTTQPTTFHSENFCSTAAWCNERDTATAVGLPPDSPNGATLQELPEQWQAVIWLFQWLYAGLITTLSNNAADASACTETTSEQDPSHTLRHDRCTFAETLCRCLLHRTDGMEAVQRL